MVRIVVNRSATLYKTFYSGTVATDPTGTPTVSVVRADGMTVTVGAVTNEAAAGTWSVTIPATSNTLLDTLAVTWTGVVNGLSQQYVDTVEVAGGVLFNLAELAEEVTATSTTTYTEAQMLAARLYAETEIEQACGVAFVPRYAYDTVSGHPTAALELRSPIRAVRSVTVDGTALSVTDLGELTARYGFLTGYTWPYGTSNIVVGYEHGYDYPSPGASEAALVLAKHKLVRGPIDERATQRPSEFGPVNLATPGMFGSRFGIPVVDAFVAANSMAVGLA